MSNTTPAIQYELQYKTDLGQSNWQSAGWFVSGSETNQLDGGKRAGGQSDQYVFSRPVVGGRRERLAPLVAGTVFRHERR